VLLKFDLVFLWAFFAIGEDYEGIPLKDLIASCLP